MPEGTAEEPIVHPSGGNETGPSHAARLAALKARVDAEDRAAKPEAPPAKAEPKAPAAKETPTAPTLEERVAELARLETQRRDARAANKRRDDEAARERDRLAKENAELRERAARADKYEKATLIERLEMLAEGRSTEEIARAWEHMGSAEHKELARMRDEGTAREKAVIARLDQLEQREQERMRGAELRAAEQRFASHFDGAKASYPFLAKMPIADVIRLAHGEADELHSMGHEVTHEAILTSLEAKTKRLAAMFGVTATEAAEAMVDGGQAEPPKRQPPGRATPKLTQRAAQETAKVNPQGRVSHRDRVRRLIAREDAR